MNAGKTFGRTIQLFLVDGKPSGLQKATIHGWTGLLFVSGASAFGALTAREEVDRTGVYILSGARPRQARRHARLYRVGQFGGRTDRAERQETRLLGNRDYRHHQR